MIVTSQSQTIRENTTLAVEGFGGWLAQNTGNVDVIVDGFVLAPGDVLDLTNIAAGVVWSSPIVITFPDLTQVGSVRVMRLMYQ